MLTYLAVFTHLNRTTATNAEDSMNFASHKAGSFKRQPLLIWFRCIFCLMSYSDFPGQADYLIQWPSEQACFFIFTSPAKSSLWIYKIQKQIVKCVRPDTCIYKLYQMPALFMIIQFYVWGQFNLANAFYTECSDFVSQFRLNINWQLIRLVTATPSLSSLSTLPRGN